MKYTAHQANLDENTRLPLSLTWTKLQWVAPRWNEGRTVNSSTHYLRYNWSSGGAIPVLPKLASRHRLPQRVQLVGWNLVTSFESQKRSLVARSSAEAEYRADAKAPGRDFPLKSHTLGEGISFYSFHLPEMRNYLSYSIPKSAFFLQTWKKRILFSKSNSWLGCLFERRKPFERKMNVNVPVRLGCKSILAYRRTLKSIQLHFPGNFSFKWERLAEFLSQELILIQ